MHITLNECIHYMNCLCIQNIDIHVKMKMKMNSERMGEAPNLKSYLYEYGVIMK